VVEAAKKTKKSKKEVAPLLPPAEATIAVSGSPEVVLDAIAVCGR
jgi:hypothetical protein